MGLIGMAATLFMAGMELDWQRIRGRPLSLAVQGWALSLALGLGAAGLLYLLPVVHAPIMVALALTTTALTGVNTDLLHAEPDAWHRLPIVRLEPALDAPELEPRYLPDVVWESPDRVSSVPEPDQGLVAHVSIYKNLDVGVNVLLAPAPTAGPGPCPSRRSVLS
jgi:hypothetical protein